MIEPNLKIIVNKRQYSKLAVLLTSNAFSNDAFFLIQNGENKDLLEVLATLRNPENAPDHGEAAARQLFARFQETLRENQIRVTLMKKNKPQRVQMLNHALTNPVLDEHSSASLDIPESIAKILEEDTGDESYLDDPLNIAVPWEEKT